MTAAEPAGRRPRHLTWGRIGVYAFLVTSALFFLLPLWIMLLTSVKTMDEIRLGNILACLPTPRSSHGSRPGARPAPGSPATASRSASGTRCGS